MQRTTLVAAMAAMLAFSVQAANPDAVMTGAARKALELKLTQADAQGQVYIQQSFTNPGETSLPTGWRKPGWNKGTVALDPTTGNLLIDGRANGTQMTGLMLPAALESLSNYRVDVEYTIDATLNNDAARWVSVMYRTSPETGAIAYDPYHQFAIRQNAAASNGTEFALRTGGNWRVESIKPFPEIIDKAKTYRATVIVHGNRVRQYLNDTLQHDTTITSGLAQGGIGLQTAGALYRVKSVKVTEQITPLPEFDLPIAVQDTGTAASMAPSLVQGMTSLAAKAGDGSSNSLYTLDSALNLRGTGGEALGTLQELFAQTSRITVPVVRVQDQATVDALVAFSNDVRTLGDITFVSDNVGLLADLRARLSATRTAVDFTAAALPDNSGSLLRIVGETNRAGAKIAILPPALTTRANVSYLQRMLITVWAQSDAGTAQDAANVLTTGVNGVVSTRSALFADVLRQLPANTLLRKPLITGHRGMPAGGDYDENTLESAKAAVDAGADAVENDIYITKDGHLVIMHDATVDRTTNGSGAIENMTLAEVKALRTKGKGLEVPTMREFFQAFKGKPITHFIEIKSGTPSVVAKLKEEMAAEATADQSVAISFDTAQLERSREQIPELTLGLLNTNADGTVPMESLRKVLDATQTNGSTYNPSYGGVKRETLEAAKHRGTTYWPWTLNGEADFYKFYSWGIHGITTDFARWAKAFPVEIEAAGVPAKIELNQPLSLDVKLTTQGKVSSVTAANELVLIGGTAQADAPVDGKLTFKTAGTAFVLPGYRHQMGTSSYSYVIVGKPVALVVGDGTGSVTGTSNSTSGGSVACSGAVPGQSSACTITPMPGYAVAGVAPGGDCPAGAWNADFTVYTTGVIQGNCSVNFSFKPLPVEASLAVVGKSGSVSATVTGGGTGLWAFDAGSALSVAAAQSTPENVRFPFGVTSFKLNGGEAGQQATVELVYPEALPTDAKYYKYGKTKANAEAHWYVFGGAQISGNKVTLTLTDGEDGDSDLVANGSISDPGGVGVAAAGPVTPPAGNVAPVPTLGAGGLIGLSWAVGALAWMRSRRSRRNQRSDGALTH
ncbi:glycerophosphodiester phosphodiesterase family protein [Diaphorobacter caeni]|uniref:glycerophosphodiester phosphodiesterase family protein n=1 Tax=Diaphorobacter caeni TaxID=2784387 RepID=UPI00189035A0|nr:glycerophosphodiester phosphodiesterase family protein [Diaphorobacter caeni]MBF5006127.1 hypothetical protein [Diaphorobacter caeni]